MSDVPKGEPDYGAMGCLYSGTFRTPAHPPDPAPTIDEMRAQIDRFEREHGQPMVRLLAGDDVYRFLRMHMTAKGETLSGGILAEAFGVPVRPALDLAPDEWAPVYRARKR